jgi:hypothetical protein
MRSANIRGGFWGCGGGSSLAWQGTVLPGDGDFRLVLESCTFVGVGVEDLGLVGVEASIELVKNRLAT